MTSFRMGDILVAIEEEAKRQGVDPVFARANIIAENTGSGRFNPDQLVSKLTTSAAGAFGIGQVMPKTFEGLVQTGRIPADTDPKSFSGQIRAAVAAMKEAEQWAGKDPVALAVRYNASLPTFNRWKAGGGDMSLLPAETQEHVRKVKTAMNLPLTSESTGQSASVRTTKKVFPPGTLEEIESLRQDQATEGDRLLKLLQSATGQFSEEAAAAKVASEAAGAAEVRGIKAKADADVEKLQRDKNLLQMFGIDQARLQQTLQGVAEAQTQLETTGTELAQLRSVSFLDDPIKWLGNQFQIAAKSEQYNAAAQRFNAGTETIGTLAARAGAVMQLTPATNEALIRDAEAAEAEVALQRAKLRSFEISSRELSPRLAAITTEMSQAGIKFSSALAAAKLVQEVANMNFAIEERENQRQGKTAEDRRIGQELQHANKWRALANLQQYSQDDWLSMSAAKRTEILEYSKSNQLTIANSPGKSISLLAQENGYESFMQGHPNREVRKQFWDSITGEAKDKVRASAAAVGKSLSDKQFAELVEQEIDQIFRTWNSDPALANRQYNKLLDSHPLRLKPWIAAGAPGLAGNFFAQYVQGLGMQAEQLRDKDIYAYAAATVASGARPQQVVAKELSDFFRTGSAWQSASYGLAIMGANTKGPKGVAEYPMSAADMFGFWEGIKNPIRQNVTDQAIQLFNPVDVERALVLSVIKSKQSPLSPATRLTPTNLSAIKGPAVPGSAILGGSTPQGVPQGQPSIYDSPDVWNQYRQQQAGKP